MTHNRDHTDVLVSSLILVNLWNSMDIGTEYNYYYSRRLGWITFRILFWNTATCTPTWVAFFGAKLSIGLCARFYIIRENYLAGGRGYITRAHGLIDQSGSYSVSWKLHTHVKYRSVTDINYDALAMNINN